MEASHEFFGLLGAAAATLLGLLFVSVSLNAKIILGASQGHSMRLAEQMFGGVQMASDNTMHTLVAFGSLVLLVAATGISWELLIKIAESGSPKSDP